MAKGIFNKSGSLAALAAGLAMIVAPVAASAQEGRGGWRGRSDSGQQQQRVERQAPREARVESRGEARGFSRIQAPRAQQSAPVVRQQQSQPQQVQRGWQGPGDGGNGVRQGRGDRDGSTVRNWQGPAIRNGQNVDRNPQWRDGNRGEVRRADRDNNRRFDRGDDNNRRWDRNDNNNRRWDRGDNDRRWDRGDNRRWNNGWRNDRRYDWSSYRSSNRNAYRLGRYYAPYRNYYYRPLSSGFRLDSLFFGSNYWINDPWQYRLPPAYGDYRWVRYYDDVVLVDTYTGEVVDVIRDFFW